MKKTYIYSLVCPLDGKVKYVGKANDPKGRFRKHKSLGDTNTGDNIEKNKWIKSLLDQGLLPILEILEEVDVTEWKEKEKFYVRQFREQGVELFNICGGGNGATFGNSGSFKGNPPVKVVCLTKQGDYVNTFNSVKEGKEFSGKRIDNVLAGKRKTSGGYIWLYEKVYNELTKEELNVIVENANINNSSINGLSTRWKKGNKSWNKGKKGFISKKRKKVHQYTLDGIYLKTWEYAGIAAKEYNCSIGNITMCAGGRTKSAVGYKWVYEVNI
jgi:hypothetical protein